MAMGIFRLWRTFVGLVLAIVPTVTHGLDVAGYIDFVIGHGENPGWVGVVLNYLIEPPTFLTIPLIACGLALVWWDVRVRSASAKIVSLGRERKPPNHKSVIQISRLMPTLARRTNVIAMKYPDPLEPDWATRQNYLWEVLSTLIVTGKVYLYGWSAKGDYVYEEIPIEIVKRCTFDSNDRVVFGPMAQLIWNESVIYTNLCLKKSEIGNIIDMLNSALII